MSKCAGRNCTSMDGTNRSPECLADYEKSCGGFYPEIKNCPFCGNSCGHPQTQQHKGGRWTVSCMNPGCGSSSGFCDTELEAIDIWNKRTNEIELAASEEERKKAIDETKYYWARAKSEAERAEAAEKLIEDSRKQEPVAYIVAEQVDNGIGISVDSALSWDKVESHAYPSTPLYTQPPIHPELSEVMRERDELKRKIAEQQIKLDKAWLIADCEDASEETLDKIQAAVKNEPTEFVKLLEEAKRQAVPEGWKLVPEDATEEMIQAADKVDWSDSDVHGNYHNLWHLMLSASPTYKEQP